MLLYHIFIANITFHLSTDDTTMYFILSTADITLLHQLSTPASILHQHFTADITQQHVISYLLHTISLIVTHVSKRTSCLSRSKLTVCYFLYGCSFSSILVQKFLKLDIGYLRYDNFIKDVITD